MDINKMGNLYMINWDFDPKHHSDGLVNIVIWQVVDHSSVEVDNSCSLLLLLLLQTGQEATSIHKPVKIFSGKHF